MLERGQRITVLTVDGGLTVLCNKSVVNADTLYNFSRSYLVSNIHPTQLCCLTNVSEVTDLFEQAGIMVILLLPYSLSLVL